MSEYTTATYAFDERKHYVQDILNSLRSGDLVVKARSDGTVTTFGCPFCPKRRKQLFFYKDILQHTEALATGKSKETTDQANHCALATYLTTDLAHLAPPPPPPSSQAHKLELNTKAPQREDLKAQDLLLCPWSMIIHNLQTTMDNKGIYVGPSMQEVKKCFSSFEPQKVHVIWGPMGHMGIGVITFRGDFEGWKNAQAFERWFTERDHGRRDWERKLNYNLPTDTEPYGWLARKDDYTGRSKFKGDSLVAKYLQDRGPLELKDIGMIGDDLKRMHEQRYQHLAEELHEKNSEYHHLVADIERAKRNAEITIAQLEKKHRQELDELNAKARLSSQEHTTQMRALNMVLQSSMEKLKSRCQDLREKEKLRQTQGERIQLEQAKMENQWKLDVVNEQSEIQKKHQAAQMALIRKHEMENEHLAEWIQFKKMTLAKKHLKELENQRLEEMRESKKFMQLAHSIEDPEYLSDKGAMDLEEKITLMEKQKGELIEELEDLKLDNEAHNETILALTKREKIANDEVQQARQAAELVIEDVGSTSTLYIRKMGEIDEGPWKKACEERFSNHKGGWEVAFRTKYSRWEERIRNPNFAPFTYVLVGGNRERHIDYSDKKLLNLQEKLGNAVVKTVVRALEEIEEFNSCGRYPVSTIWNEKEGRIATLKEVMEYLHQLLKQPKQRKRARLNVNI